MFRLDPTEGSEQGGTRPIVIVSRNSINHNAIGNRSIVVMGVPTTDRENLEELYPSHVELKKGIGGLTKDSVALCEQARAVSVDRLVRYMGKLPLEHLEKIEQALRNVMML
jgi:mRNA interferase MazF